MVDTIGFVNLRWYDLLYDLTLKGVLWIPGVCSFDFELAKLPKLTLA